MQNTPETVSSAYRTLRIWRQRSQELTELHDAARAYYRRINEFLTISSLVLGTFSSSTAIFTGGSAIAASGGVSGTWNIALGAMGVLSTIIVSINTHMAPAKLQQAHHECQSNYNKLAREITVQLHLEKTGTDRVFSNIHQCLRYMQMNFDDLEDSAPAIPKFIIQKVYDERMTKKHIRLPPVYETERTSVDRSTRAAARAPRHSTFSIDDGHVHCEVDQSRPLEAGAGAADPAKSYRHTYN